MVEWRNRERGRKIENERMKWGEREGGVRERERERDRKRERRRGETGKKNKL